jgi:hypothetical protein
LFENFSVNSLKGDLSNDITDNPPLFSLVSTFKGSKKSFPVEKPLEIADYVFCTHKKITYCRIRISGALIAITPGSGFVFKLQIRIRIRNPDPDGN